MAYNKIYQSHPDMNWLGTLCTRPLSHFHLCKYQRRTRYTAIDIEHLEHLETCRLGNLGTLLLQLFSLHQHQIFHSDIAICIFQRSPTPSHCQMFLECKANTRPLPLFARRKNHIFRVGIFRCMQTLQCFDSASRQMYQVGRQSLTRFQGKTVHPGTKNMPLVYLTFLECRISQGNIDLGMLP